MNSAFVKLVQDEFGFNLREKTRQDFLGLLWENGIPLVDFFKPVIDQQIVKQYMMENNANEGIAELVICLDVLGKVCKSPEPYTPEQQEKLKQLRKKYKHICNGKIS